MEEVTLPPLPEKAGWAPALDNQDIYTAEQLRAYAQQAASAAVLQERAWREAVLDQLAVTCMDAPIGTPPAEILKSVIDWNVMVALDPAVSEAANKLILAERERCAKLCDDKIAYWSFHHLGPSVAADCAAAIREGA